MKDQQEHSISPFVAREFGRIPVTAGSLILDLPCGEGRHSLWLAANGFRVVAADIDASRVATLRNLLDRSDLSSKVLTVVADAERPLPFADQMFDVVLVVHYYNGRIAEIAAPMLKPGGQLILETFGAQGNNWLHLPKSGTARALVENEFEVLRFRERPAGPQKDRAVVLLHGRKR